MIGWSEWAFVMIIPVPLFLAEGGNCDGNKFLQRRCNLA